MDIILNDRQTCDFELLVNGGFTPLNGFLKKNEYKSVLKDMRLPNGNLWPMPICLAITEEMAKTMVHYKTVKMKDKTGLPLGEIEITDDSIYSYNWRDEAKAVFGTDDINHPFTKILKNQYESGYTYYIGGKILNGKLPPHYDFKEDRMTPAMTKEYFKKNNWNKIVGFQTRNPMHRSHYELSKYALKMAGEDAKVLVHPVVGMTQDCDIDYHTRVRCYKHLMNYYPENTAKLSLLPLSMRMAGPREAVWHALIRKNYGCTHFVVGRDHAGPSYKKKDGSDFFGPYDAQDLLMSVKDEIGMELVVSKLIVYAIHKKTGVAGYHSIDSIDSNDYIIKKISGTQQRQMLNEGIPIPQWFSFPEVIDELTKEFAVKNKKGLCLYFVGLSGCGKTTIANALMTRLKEKSLPMKMTYLDGDIVRTHLSKGLGFNKTDRSINIRRIGYVASEVVKHGGLCMVANIAPYQADRDFNKDMISNQGDYFQIWVNTSLEICEERDCKGLYKMAREGKIKEFTGISDPFEEPTDSDMIIDGSMDLDYLVNMILKELEDKKLL